MVAPSTKRLGSYLKIRIKKGPGCNMQKKGGLQRKDTESSTLRYIMGGTDNWYGRHNITIIHRWTIIRRSIVRSELICCTLTSRSSWVSSINSVSVLILIFVKRAFVCFSHRFLFPKRVFGKRERERKWR